MDDFFPFFTNFGFLGILDPLYCGIGATIRISREKLCLLYAGLFFQGLFLALKSHDQFQASHWSTTPPGPLPHKKRIYICIFIVVFWNPTPKEKKKISRLRETKHLLTDAGSSTDTTEGWTKNTQKTNKKEEKTNHPKRKYSKTSRIMPKLAIRPSTRGP